MIDYTLVICEKEIAAKRIASALGRYYTKKINGISVFLVRDYVICHASGHLYNLTTNKKSYPVFDPQWSVKPNSSRIINVIKELAANAKEFINACDLDQEGEVIAYNILTFACNNAYNKAYRARFSTLTDNAILKAFSNLEQSYKLKGLADAGVTRHTLDFIYGINLSRALIDASKRILSIGRVQGPTLAFIIEREIERETHIPKPYWIIEVLLAKNDQRFRAEYESIIDNKDTADKILNVCKDKDGTVKDLERELVYLKPPTPFNLTDLQKDAYNYLRLIPSKTLSIAEKLYLNAYISYPRTSSQRLPRIDYKEIIINLAKIKSYEHIVSDLLSKERLTPNNGSKDDPAHPAIHPTGEIPKNLTSIEFKVYDLITRRFLATFMDPAIVDKVSVTIDIQGYIFKSEGKSILEESWLKIYGRYKEIYLPELNINDILQNIDMESKERFTSPKPRFNAASLLILMEEEKIGTKSTRAMIIDTLIKRGYTTPKLEPTLLGFAIFDLMSDYMPEILSVELTRAMEDKLEMIERDLLKPSIVISDAIESLIKVLNRFIDNKRLISMRLDNI